MAQIVLKILANEDIGETITGKSADKSVNNVSSALTTITTRNDGMEGLPFGNGIAISQGYVGGTAKLMSEVNKYNGYMFGLTNGSGEYTLTLSLYGTNLDKILIIGDKTANQFPIEAILDEGTPQEKTLTSDDVNWAIGFAQESTSHTIKFTKWNRANYNACFTTIEVLSRYLTLDRGWINQLSTLSQSTSDAGDINYGIIANSGNAEIQDLDGEIKDYVADGVIEPSNVPIELYINNNKVQTHITTDSNYVEKDKALKLDFTNTTSLWENITYNTRALTPMTTLYVLLNEVLVSLGYTSAQISTMLSKTMVYGTSPASTGTVENYLKAINIPYPYLNADKANATINKICTLAQLNMYMDENNLPVFVSARPLATNSEIANALHITKTFMKSELEKSIILKNKYNGVDMSAKQVVDALNIDSNYTTKNITPTSTYLTSNVKYDGKAISTTGVALISVFIARIERYYTSGTFTIPKKMNGNLVQIEKIEGVDFSLKMQNYNGTCSASATNYSSPNYEFNQTARPANGIVWGTTHTESYGKIGDDSILIQDANHSASVSLTDDSSITYTEDSDNIYITYNILTKMVKMPLSGIVNANSSTTIAESRIQGDVSKKEAIECSISIKGNVRKVEFEDIDVSTAGIEQATTIITIETNELLQEGAMYNSTTLTTKIKNDIFADYSNGVSNGSVEIFCGDAYLANNTKQLDWQQGQIIKPNDIVYFDNDLKPDNTQRYWRITGRTFNYNGAPSMKLELREIVGIY